MISTDETKAVLELLQAQSALTVVTSTRIWADVDQPPSSYKPADGIGICFKVRGGTDGDPRVLVHPSFQFKVYGTKPNESPELTVRNAARLLHDNLDEKTSKDILTVYREVMPVTLREPDAEWIYALVFYKVMIRNLN